MRGPIVVGADGSDTSRLAIEEAASMARGSGQSVVVVFVRHDNLTRLGVPWTGGLETGAVQEVLSVNQSLVEAQSVAILDSLCIDWRFEVREGEPAHELIRSATEAGADTIVVAGRRHGALGALASASVCSQLLHRWPRSLLVIHPHSEASDTMKTMPGEQA